MSDELDKQCAMCGKKAESLAPTEAGQPIPLCQEHDLKTLDEEEDTEDYENYFYGEESNMSQLIEDAKQKGGEE